MVNMTIYGPQHSAQQQREALGERPSGGPGTAAAAKRSLDVATREYERVKLAQAREQAAQGAPERAEAARQAISTARTPRELDEAFRSAQRSLRR
jgi:hypothetical protein